MEAKQPKLSTGIVGLDEITNGGFVIGSTNLLRGGPGVGKTTIGIHFLLEGVKQNENSLFITLGEPTSNIKRNASQLGLNVEKITFLDLSPEPDFFSKVETYDIFTPAEVEREPTTRQIVETIEKVKPVRVFLDAMTQFKFLSTDNFQFRKQVLSFLHYLQDNHATILFTTESSALAPDDDLQFMADAVIHMENNENGRFISISKFRGSDYLSGKHSYKIAQNGIKVFPRIVPKLEANALSDIVYQFGVPTIDELLGGGVEKGTIILVSGPSGVGKTTIAMQLAKNIATHHAKSAYYTFEEDVNMLIKRCQSIGIDAHKNISEGFLDLKKIEPLIYSADEFSHLVYDNAVQNNVSVVVIDSTSGFNLSLNGENIVTKMHALCKQLQGIGVTTVLINEVENITGDFKITEERLSYLSDTIIFLRYLEIDGKLRKAIGVLKKRLSNFEKTLREFEIASDGITVGEPLVNLRGILLGVPEWVGDKPEKI
ncbi:MAG TPA: recombinase RecA [Prolixibacteraceae bacterium]|nr:recombinase RecA [Prolixibacteraceae bacterium]